ncbi:hypothetical protein [Streptomyces sp. NPDC001502]|uniref:hypothetical protein n=1 Tax=Streptomyces sp. NPDC001502 TaxID=3364578 RepID=UPI0036C5FA50
MVVGSPIAVRLARRTSVRLGAPIAPAAAAVSMGSFALFGAAAPIAWYAAAVLVQGTALAW